MQSRWMSFVEAITNIVVGYGLAVLTQVVVFPLFGLHASLGENFLLAALFTCISLIRSFTIRRLFNAVQDRAICGAVKINDSLTKVNDHRFGSVNHPATLTD